MFFHPKIDKWRAVTHTPPGAIFALAATYLPWPVAVCGVALFLAYEWDEGRHTKDQAWKDILGAVIGYFITTATILIITFL